jgi:hypothetical protein
MSSASKSDSVDNQDTALKLETSPEWYFLKSVHLISLGKPKIRFTQALPG